MKDNEEVKKSTAPTKSAQAEREEAVLQFWADKNIFQKTVEKESPKGEYVFYEGPPTANAAPALHHLEARAFKDVMPRYKTMQGFHVPRRAGWDTHGLPVELQIEKKLGLKSKKEIEEYGVAKFNKECRENVFEFIGEWEKFTDRIGYWVDKSKAYYTFDTNFVESLWSIVKKVDDRGLLYKDYRIVPWCARCGTALASHELAQGYMDVKDLSVTAKFKIKGQDNAYFLAWTTTPWTLPGNVALAVGKDIDYVYASYPFSQKIEASEKITGQKVSINRISPNQILILAKNKIDLLEDGYEIIKEVKGSEMVGMEYEPLYPFLSEIIATTPAVNGKENPEKEKMPNAYKVYAADFVTTEDGTGIVHTAVMYGADDFDLGNKVGLPKFHTVNLEGKFISGTGFLEGRFVKDEDVAVDIIKDLANRPTGSLLFKKEKYEHNYPHCWRCKTPLIYYARDSWYISMSKLRDELVSENEKINWEPEHIKEGRFGEWVKEVKDWAISRERYWGTPLPVWVAEDGERMIVDSFETIKKYVKRSGNTYFVMRHGETDGNLKNLVTDEINEPSELTENGKKVVAESAEKLKQETELDYIFYSPFARTKNTAMEVAEAYGLSADKLIEDARLGEMYLGATYNGKTWDDFHAAFPKKLEYFAKAPDGGESYQMLQRRMMSFIFDIEEKYKGKKILIVTHGGPAWSLETGVNMLSNQACLDVLLTAPNYRYYKNAEYKKINFAPYPHNEQFELDPHRPYIDEVILEKDGKEFRRVKEVMDVWFDSGSMPFAQDHYPFENKEWIETKGYPADFISEAIDQTRGWFYTLLAVGVLMGRGTPYKNVICLGHLLDKDGKKMSKSIGNIVNPWEQMDKYGVDVLRLWMFSVNQPGEGKNYDENVVRELASKTLGLTYNVLAFYELYRDRELEATAEKELQNGAGSQNVLDQWILARLNQVIIESTTSLDSYRMIEPVRSIRDFIGDMSTWYLRRSRDRIKDTNPENKKDTESAKQTLYVVLKKLAQVLAPFAPFAAEDIWQKLKNGNDVESIHLSTWPIAGVVNDTVLADMDRARMIVEKALAARQENKIPVRQPLSKISISETMPTEYFDVIKDELNIKEVVVDEAIPKGEVVLETEITPELRAEGMVRELMRAMQDMRKAADLTPSDVITLSIEADEDGVELIEKFADDIKKTVLVERINFAANDGEEVKVGDKVFKVKIEK
jgi:isoleucyl-tRNA synthetase